jgi:alkylated DNA repair protein alkB family protein 7
MRSSRTARQLQAAHGLSHSLVKPSPSIRSLGKASHVSDDLEHDFQLYPDFFSSREVESLVKMSLWKLDRADSTRRRRGKGPIATAVNPGVQGLFESVDKYGFQEVSG